MEEQAIRNLVTGVKWLYSKTYPKAPHEYTVFEWAPDRINEFREFAQHIKDHGGWEPFFNRKTWYFRFEDRKYWIMSAPWECILINRTFTDVAVEKSVREFVMSPAFQFQKGMCLDDIVSLIKQRGEVQVE